MPSATSYWRRVWRHFKRNALAVAGLWIALALMLMALLADVLGGLPAALAARGEQVAVVTPAYRQNQYPIPPREAYRNLWIPLGTGYAVDVYAGDADFVSAQCQAHSSLRLLQHGSREDQRREIVS